MESLILAAGLILFSGTVSYDVNHKEVAVNKGNTVNTSAQVEKGFFDQDVRK